MPNHCHNRVTIYGSGNDTDETRAQIAKLKQIFEDESTFGQIIPEPDWANTPLDEKTAGNWLHSKRGEVGELPQPDGMTGDYKTGIPSGTHTTCMSQMTTLSHSK